MKKLNIIIMLIVTFTLSAQALFEIKDASDNAVLEVSQDGLRIFNQGDTLMVISSSEIKAFVDDSSKDKGLSRSFSVSTNATGKGGGDNLMKISNNPTFETVNDSIMLWYKQRNAFRVGYVLITDPNNVGQGSFASGYKSQASGKFSTALGYWAQASGENAFASGQTSWATGDNSCAIGKDAHATNSSSIAVGTSTEASGSSSFAAGNLTKAEGANSCAIGMGCKATGEYGMAFGSGLTLASGYVSTAIGSSVQATYQGAVAIGVGSTSTNSYAVSMGRLNEASGYGSTAIGYYNDATDYYTTALGYYTEATDNYATSMGRYTNATGYNSTAMGYNSTAVGNYSTAMGYYTEARQYCATAIGRYNTVGGSSTSWVTTDALFLIGNGTSTTSRSDAMKVKKNGQVFFPSLYTQTTTNSFTDLKVDSNGMLCTGSKGGLSDDEEIELLKQENTKLYEKLDLQEERIKKLEELTAKLLK